ncbi:MAG: hypothetical protein ACP5D0_07880 [Hydrogenovibrio sp.]
MLWMLPGLAFSDSRMHPKTVVLGNPVTWVLSGEQVDKAFAALDLSAIERHFAVRVVETGSSRMRVKLYPYQVGEFSLPSMTSKGVNVEAVTIQVTENPAVKIEWQPPPEGVYPHQVVYWRARVSTEKASMRAVYLSGEAPLDGRYQWLDAPVAESVNTVFGHDTELTYALRFDTAGKQSVPSPAIRVDVSAYRHELFFAPPASVAVKPLPSYLPAVLPMEAVSLQAAFNPFWVVAGDLYHWHWSLEGQGVPLSQWPNLTAQLADSQGVEWLLPNVERAETMTLSGLRSEVRVDQPLRILAMGWVRLPPLRVTYFNPETGRLEDVQVPSQSVISVPRAVFFLIQVLAAGLVILMLWLGGYFLRQIWALGHLRWRLQRCDSVEGVWFALQAWLKSQPGAVFSDSFSPQPLSPSSLSRQSIGQWRAAVASGYGRRESCVSLEELVKCLNRHVYALPPSADFDVVRQAAQRWAREQPWMRWPRWPLRLGLNRRG